MPFGLMDTPIMFLRMATTLFNDLSIVIIYVVDAVTSSHWICDHLVRITNVCDRLREACSRLKLLKYSFLVKRLSA